MSRIVLFVFAGVVALAAILLLGFTLVSGIPVYAHSRSASFRQVTSSTNRFKYDPHRVEVGTLYHYVKSNVDGSKAAPVDLYVSSPQQIQAYKLYPGAAAPDLVVADMDWALMSARLLRSYEVQRDGSLRTVATGRLEPGDRYRFEISNLLWVKNATSTISTGHYPVHVYNFDLTSLNFSFRFLKDPTKDFEFGVQMPCFDMLHLGKVEYIGTATVHYVGEETLHKVACRKYVVSGEAFGGKQGQLWVARDGGYFELAEFPVRDNPGWKDFKLELTGIEHLNADQWQSYMRTRTEAFYAKRGQ